MECQEKSWRMPKRNCHTHKTRKFKPGTRALVAKICQRSLPHAFISQMHFSFHNGMRIRYAYSEIRKRTKIIDIIEYTLKQKWRWAGHIARMKDNRWTKRCTEWQPRRGKRSRGRPSRRWQDDITRKGGIWNRKATGRRQWKTLMEGYILQWMDKAQVKGER